MTGSRARYTKRWRKRCVSLLDAWQVVARYSNPQARLLPSRWNLLRTLPFDNGDIAAVRWGRRPIARFGR